MERVQEGISRLGSSSLPKRALSTSKIKSSSFSKSPMGSSLASKTGKRLLTVNCSYTPQTERVVFSQSGPGGVSFPKRRWSVSQVV